MSQHYSKSSSIKLGTNVILALLLCYENVHKHKTQAFSSTSLLSINRRVNTLSSNVNVHFKPLNLQTTNQENIDYKLDDLLSSNNLKAATRLLKNNSSNVNITNDRLVDIFRAIEVRTLEAEENNINKRFATDANFEQYPTTSPARMEMTDMYQTLKSTGQLQVFGAAANGNVPAQGSKILTPTLLEKITQLSMTSLTPKPTNTLLLAGVALAVAEGILSLSTGIDLNFLLFFTLFFAFLDKLLVNGAVFETAVRISMPEYSRKILKHEAGHFLCAYLLGCPVEGCVLSTWAALADARFGGRRTTVSAGTSFFDPELSDEINGRKPVSRASIDRYSIIVMGGIAAEALNFGMADGGAGDEMALVAFLSNLNPRGGGAQSWNVESIKNQARWGVAQAVLLLREYKDCYEALVDALERGGTLGDCVLAIESAAKEKGLPTVAQRPLGYILDEGVYGAWSTSLPSSQIDVVTTSSSTPVVPKKNELSSSLSTPEKEMKITNIIDDEIVSLEVLKKRMEEKLKDIDAQLENL